jgi:ribosome-associated protein
MMTLDRPEDISADDTTEQEKLAQEKLPADPLLEAVQESERIATDEKMRLIAQWLQQKKALDIIGLDISKLSNIAEGIIVATAKSGRHARTLAEETAYEAKKRKFDNFGTEGIKSENWVLVDMNDVLVHIFQSEARNFYNLEGLWADAPRVDLGLADVQKADDGDDLFDDDFDEL